MYRARSANNIGVVAPVQAGEIIAGKYEIERVLASGGMGVVVLANHQTLRRRVAIKFLLTELMHAPIKPEAVARFVREGQAAGRLHGENVARVIDVDTMADGRPYMVMEYLEGMDLGVYLANQGRLPVSEAADYVLQACVAMAEAHLAGIVHRDLKPSNLFLTRRPDGSPLVKVLDFGISKLYADPGGGKPVHHTQTALTMGSPAYMAPEQAASAKHVDARADIWSLGVILYELTAGRVPLDVSGGMASMVAQLICEEPLPLSEAAPDLPADFCAMVHGCLRKEPDERYQRVAELAMALAPFASVRGRVTVASIRAIDSERGPAVEARHTGPQATGPQAIMDDDATGPTQWPAPAPAAAPAPALVAGVPGTPPATIAPTPGMSAEVAPTPAHAALRARAEAEAQTPAGAQAPAGVQTPSGGQAVHDATGFGTGVVELDMDAAKVRGFDVAVDVRAERSSSDHQVDLSQVPKSWGKKKASLARKLRVGPLVAAVVLAALTVMIALDLAHYAQLHVLEELLYGLGKSSMEWAGGILAVLGGSAMLVAVPIVLAVVFWRLYQPAVSHVGLWWLGANATAIAGYMSGAGKQIMGNTVGPVADWTYALAEWGIIDDAGRWGNIVWWLGMSLMATALLLLVRRGRGHGW